MGVTGVGKSTFINFFSDRPVPVGNDLESCKSVGTVNGKLKVDRRAGTEEIDIYQCASPGVPKFFLVDTPGFDDTNRSDADVLDQLAVHLAQAWHSKIRLAGLVYLHRISEPRFGGASRRNLRMFQKLCGDDNLASVVLATTFWKTPATEIEEQRERQLQTDERMWRPMIDRGSKVMRQDRQESSAAAIIKHLVNRRARVVLDIQHELVDQNKTIAQTAAGTEVLAELAVLKLKHEEEIRRLHADMKAAIEARDEHWEAEIRKERAERQAAIARDEKAKGKLRRKLNEYWSDAKDIGEVVLLEIGERLDDKGCCVM